MRVVTDRLPAGTASTPEPMVLGDPVARRSPLADSRRVAMAGALLVACAFATSLVLSRRSALWLDEAQTLSIARLPVPDLLSALRTDGAPPLYNVLLHGWMEVFGTGATAARSLSTVFALAAVALVPLAGRRFGGRRVALASAVLLATTPFLHRYATEARMYSLVVLLTVAWVVVLRDALDGGHRRALAGVAALTGALLLTHYWSFFLVAATAAMVAVALVRATGEARVRHGRVLAAMALGSLAFLPWAPSFLFQLQHTGAPWGATPGLWIFESSLRGLAGDRGSVGLLGFTYAALAAAGLWGRAVAGGRLELDFSGHRAARPLAVAVVATLALAMVVSQLSDSAFAPRYAAVVVVPFVLLAARGLATIEHRRALPAVVAVLVGMGLFESFDAAGAERTQAPEIAAALDAGAEPGDVIAYCPDQLAPGIARLVDPATAAITTTAFPPGRSGERVDWVDYLDRADGTRPDTFAASLDRMAAGSDLWLVWSPGYRAVGSSCRDAFAALLRIRPRSTRPVAEDFSAYEHAALWRFTPTRPLTTDR